MIFFLYLQNASYIINWAELNYQLILHYYFLVGHITLWEVSFLIKCIVSSTKWFKLAPGHSNPISQKSHNILTRTTDSSSDWKCSESFLIASSTSDSWNWRQSDIRSNSCSASSLDLHFSKRPTNAAAELPIKGFLAKWSFLDEGPSWKYRSICKNDIKISCIYIIISAVKKL